MRVSSTDRGLNHLGNASSNKGGVVPRVPSKESVLVVAGEREPPPAVQQNKIDRPKGIPRVPSKELLAGAAKKGGLLPPQPPPANKKLSPRIA
eukprot:3714237-Pyramimonas_sp.AAC.2